MELCIMAANCSKFAISRTRVQKYGHGRGVDGARHRYPPRSLLPPDAIAGALPQRGWLNTSAPIFSNLLSDRMPGDLLKP